MLNLPFKLVQIKKSPCSHVSQFGSVALNKRFAPKRSTGGKTLAALKTRQKTRQNSHPVPSNLCCSTHSTLKSYHYHYCVTRRLKNCQKWPSWSWQEVFWSKVKGICFVSLLFQFYNSYLVSSNLCCSTLKSYHYRITRLP